MIINSITYKIASIRDFDAMRLEIMKQLGHLIDYDGSSFYLSAPGEPGKLCRPLGINYSKDEMEKYIEEFQRIDYSEGLMLTGRNIAYRESDIIEEEVRIRSAYYQAVYVPHGWHFSIHLNLSYEEEFLGILSFFRKKGKPNFSYDDVQVLSMIKDHLAFRMSQERVRKPLLEDSPAFETLSRREREIARLLLTSLSPEEMAEKLSISINTLHKHMNHIYQKMGVKNRMQLFDYVSREEPDKSK
jgi:DNA-binding CsgD family transcriptional regulator